MSLLGNKGDGQTCQGSKSSDTFVVQAEPGSTSNNEGSSDWDTEFDREGLFVFDILLDLFEFGEVLLDFCVLFFNGFLFLFEYFLFLFFLESSHFFFQFLAFFLVSFSFLFVDFGPVLVLLLLFEFQSLFFLLLVFLSQFFEFFWGNDDCWGRQNLGLGLGLGLYNDQVFCCGVAGALDDDTFYCSELSLDLLNGTGLSEFLGVDGIRLNQEGLWLEDLGFVDDNRGEDLPLRILLYWCYHFNMMDGLRFFLDLYWLDLSGLEGLYQCRRGLGFFVGLGLSLMCRDLGWLLVLLWLQQLGFLLEDSLVFGLMDGGCLGLNFVDLMGFDEGRIFRLRNEQTFALLILLFLLLIVMLLLCLVLFL